MLQSITECYRVLQSVTKYHRVLVAHLLGPISGLVTTDWKINLIINLNPIPHFPNSPQGWNVQTPPGPSQRCEPSVHCTSMLSPSSYSLQPSSTSSQMIDNSIMIKQGYDALPPVHRVSVTIRIHARLLHASCKVEKSYHCMSCFPCLNKFVLQYIIYDSIDG